MYGGGGLVSKSCRTLTTLTVTCQAPLSVEFFRQEYWSGLSFPSPGDLPDPGIEPRVTCIARRFFIDWAMREMSLCGTPLTDRKLCVNYISVKFLESQINTKLRKTKSKSEDTASCAVKAELLPIWPPWADSSGTHRSVIHGSECSFQRFCRCCLVTQSRLTPFTTPWTIALQAPSVHGIFQARLLEWVAISSPGDLPLPEIEPTSLSLLFCRWILYGWVTWEPWNLHYYLNNVRTLRL